MPSAAARVRPPLVGRADELAALHAEFALSRRGAFGCVVLVGDPGVGKSRLADEFVQRQGSDVIALSARAYHLGAAASFGVWAEALERELRTRTAAEVARVCGPTAPDLAGLLRSVNAVSGGSPTTPPPRPRLLAALAAVLRGLAAQRPVLVVIDDLHLADASSLEALHSVAYACSDVPLFVIGTTRAPELAGSSPATEVLLRLEQDGLARRLSVLPLEPAALRELAASATATAPSDALVDWLAERTRGNPLDALGLITALLEEGADLSRPELARLPGALTDRVVLRLRGLGAAAVSVVELLAVIGRRAELRGLVALSGLPPAELGDAIEELLRARLVVEDDTGPELVYELAHPLVGDALYERMGALRRRRLHREAGRVLLALGRLGEAAGHFVRSATPGEDEAFAVLKDAVYAAERAAAFREALTVLGALVDLLPAGDPRWTELVDALSWDANWVLDHRADSHALAGIPALRAMDAAMGLLDDPARRALVQLRLASFLAWGAGDLPEAARTARSAQELFERSEDPHGALLAAHERAWISGLAGDGAAMAVQAKRIADEAGRLGDASARHRALRTLATAEVARGHFGSADVAAAEGIEAARGDGDPHRLAMALMARSASAIAQGREKDMLTALADVRAIHPEAGLELEVLCRWYAGDVAGIRARIHRIAGIGPGRPSRRTGVGLGVAAMASAEAGAHGEARRYLARSRHLYAGAHWFYGDVSDWAEAIILTREGRAPEALPLLRRAAERDLAGGFLTNALPVLADIAETAARCGWPDPEAAGQLATIAHRTGLATHAALADLARGWSSFAGGDRSTAATLAERAAIQLSPWPGQAARAWYLSGLTSADRVSAVRALGLAAEIFERLGATQRRREALDALSRLGSRGRRHAAALLGAGSLTAREREVAGLAAAGLSAREIGAALFIGERTVEGHLARAYARLGVRSKAELAARAEEFGLARTETRTSTPDLRGPGSLPSPP